MNMGTVRASGGMDMTGKRGLRLSLFPVSGSSVAPAEGKGDVTSLM